MSSTIDRKPVIDISLQDFGLNLLEMDKKDAGYLAGLLDADGSIGLYLSESNGNKRIINRVTVVSNTDFSLISHVAKLLKADVFIQKVRSENQYGGNRKALWTYRIQRREYCLAIVYFLLPYLVSKKKQAKKLEEFIRHRKDRYGKPYDEFELNMVKEFKELNKIGVK